MSTNGSVLQTTIMAPTGGLFGSQLVLTPVPVLDPAGFIGLHGNGLTPSKIDDFLCAPSHYGYKY